MERFVEAGTNGQPLVLEHCQGLVFRGGLITPKNLEEYAQKWRGHGIDLSTETNDLAVLQELLRTAVPLMIIGDHTAEPLILHAELGRFPIKIGQIETYALRLTPEAGCIARIVLHPSVSMAVNYIDEQPDHVSLGLGNDHLHLEVYYQKPIDDLPSLSPFDKSRMFERSRQF